jgi:multicomponent Na+:H+ antiporter subunit E
MSRVLYIGGVTAVYILSIGHAAAADFALGILLGAVVSAHARLPGRLISARELLRRTAGVPALVFVTVREILSGSRTMLAVTLGLRTWQRLGIVEVPFGARTELGLCVSILLIVLSPGTLVVGVDRTRRVMLVHAIDAGNAEALVGRLDQLYEKYQRHVIP